MSDRSHAGESAPCLAVFALRERHHFPTSHAGEGVQFGVAREARRDAIELHRLIAFGASRGRVVIMRHGTVKLHAAHGSGLAKYQCGT